MKGGRGRGFKYRWGPFNEEGGCVSGVGIMEQSIGTTGTMRQWDEPGTIRYEHTEHNKTRTC